MGTSGDKYDKYDKSLAKLQRDKINNYPDSGVALNGDKYDKYDNSSVLQERDRIDNYPAVDSGFPSLKET